MATDTWTGVYGGNWSDPTGWSGGTVPAAGDTVQLSQALNGPYTVHLDANEGAYAALTISAANATLALYYGGLTLSVSGATTLSAGDIAIAGDATLDTGTFAESGGFLGMSNGTLDASGQATLSGGGLGIYGGAFDAGSLAFAGGSFGISGGDVTVTNQVNETAGTAGFYAGTFDAGSLAISGGSLGMSGGTLAASGALTLSGTGSIGLYNTAATLEAGSLSQTGGSLGMSGGTLAVTGQATFTGGTDVFYGGSTVDAGWLQVGSGSAAQTLTVNGATFAVSGTASIAAGSTLSMYGGSFSTQGGLTNSGTCHQRCPRSGFSRSGRGVRRGAAHHWTILGAAGLGHLVDVGCAPDDDIDPLAHLCELSGAAAVRLRWPDAGIGRGIRHLWFRRRAHRLLFDSLVPNAASGACDRRRPGLGTRSANPARVFDQPCAVHGARNSVSCAAIQVADAGTCTGICARPRGCIPMNSIAFLKAAYLIAWVVYVGYPRKNPAAHAAGGRPRVEGSGAVAMSVPQLDCSWTCMQP